MSNQTTTPKDDWPASVPTELDPYYTAAELLGSLLAALGNSVILYVILRRRSLRQTIRNAYLASLAVADLLVAVVGIPFALLTYVGLPRQFEWCLFNNSTLLVLVYASIANLLAVTVDRFWAETRPPSYAVKMTPFRAGISITLAWTVSVILGMLPMFGWNKGRPPVPRCFFMEVIDGDYLVIMRFGTVVSSSIVIAIFNILIFRSVRRRGREMVRLLTERSFAPENQHRLDVTAAAAEVTADASCEPAAQQLPPPPRSSDAAKSELRVTSQIYHVHSTEIAAENTIESPAAPLTDLDDDEREPLLGNSPAAQSQDSPEIRRIKLKQTQLRNEKRIVQGIALLVLIFIVSMLPLYILNCYEYFCSLIHHTSTISCSQPRGLVAKICFLLSHYNSVWNPLIYAWGMEDIRCELKALLRPTNQ